MTDEKRSGWLRDYGAVTAISVGLVGALFFWAVDTQVTAQTSDLRADNAVFKVRLETIQSDVKENKKAIRQMIQNQQAILAALEKANGAKKKEDSAN